MPWGLATAKSAIFCHLVPSWSLSSRLTRPRRFRRRVHHISPQRSGFLLWRLKQKRILDPEDLDTRESIDRYLFVSLQADEVSDWYKSNQRKSSRMNLAYDDYFASCFPNSLSSSPMKLPWLARSDIRCLCALPTANHRGSSSTSIITLRRSRNFISISRPHHRESHVSKRVEHSIHSLTSSIRRLISLELKNSLAPEHWSCYTPLILTFNAKLNYCSIFRSFHLDFYINFRLLFSPSISRYGDHHLHRSSLQLHMSWAGMPWGIQDRQPNDWWRDD